MELRKFRSDYNLSQKDLADIFGCKQSNISLMEKGERTVTGLQVRLLIEKYGFDAVAKYADPSELPAGPAVTIDMSKTRTEIKDVNGPVLNGSGTQTTTDAGLVETMKMQAQVLSNQSQQITSLIQQQARLIALLESAQK